MSVIFCGKVSGGKFYRITSEKAELLAADRSTVAQRLLLADVGPGGASSTGPTLILTCAVDAPPRPAAGYVRSMKIKFSSTSLCKQVLRKVESALAPGAGSSLPSPPPPVKMQRPTSGSRARGTVSNQTSADGKLTIRWQTLLPSDESADSSRLPSDVNLALFQRTVALAIEGIFLSCNSAAHGFVEVATRQSAPQKISILGNLLSLVPVIGNAAGAAADITSQQLDQRNREKLAVGAQRIASLLSMAEIAHVAAAVADRLASAFHWQLQRLARPDETPELCSTTSSSSSGPSFQTGGPPIGLAADAAQVARSATHKTASLPPAAGGGGLGNVGRSGRLRESRSWFHRAARVGGHLIKSKDNESDENEPFAVVSADFCILLIMVKIHALASGALDGPGGQKLQLHGPQPVIEFFVDAVLDLGPGNASSPLSSSLSSSSSSTSSSSSSSASSSPLVAMLSSLGASGSGTGSRVSRRQTGDVVVFAYGDGGEWQRWALADMFFLPGAVCPVRRGHDAADECDWHEWVGHGSQRQKFGLIVCEEHNARRRGLTQCKEKCTPPSHISLTAVAAMPPAGPGGSSQQHANKSVDEVVALISALNLVEHEHVAQLFRSQGIDGALLVSMTDADLRDLGVALWGDRKKILTFAK